VRTALREHSSARPRDPAPADAGDADLLNRARAGDDEAYGELYRRHADAGLRLARRLTSSAAAAEDLVGDAFAAVLVALRNGSGPTEAFRPYLLTTIRRRSWRGAGRPEDPVDPTDPTAPLDRSVLDADGDDARLLVDAYRSLPERWQLVLWHTEVEGQAPAAVAPLVGLSPHATAALAHRAREGLREAFLQAHLREDAVPTACRPTVTALGALVRGRAGSRDRSRAEAHLAGCERCRRLRAELLDVNRALRSVVGPAVLGGAAAAYLGTRAGGGPGTAAAGAGRAAGRLTGRHAAVLGTAVAAGLALLLLVTDVDRTAHPDDAARDLAAAAVQRGPVVVGAPDGPSATAGPTLVGAGTLRAIADPACSTDLGVAVTTVTTGAAGAAVGSGATEDAGVVRAVLVPAGAAGLPVPGALDGALRPVTGALAGTLRTLVAAPAATASPATTAVSAGGACVQVAPAALLTGGPWALLVAYLPTGAGGLDDLRFAVLGRPLGVLGATARAALSDARTALADGLRSLDPTDPAATVAGTSAAVDDLLGGAPTATTGDLLAPLAGGTGVAPPTSSSPPTTTAVLPGVDLPLDPVITVPPLPLTIPTLPLLP